MRILLRGRGGRGVRDWLSRGEVVGGGWRVVDDMGRWMI